MKKLSIAILFGISLMFINCGSKDVHTAQECEAAIDKAINTVKAELSKQELTEEQKGQLTQFDALMMGAKPKVIKKCQKGKMNLKCLESAKDQAALVACFQ